MFVALVEFKWDFVLQFGGKVGIWDGLSGAGGNDGMNGWRRFIFEQILKRKII